MKFVLDKISSSIRNRIGFWCHGLYDLAGKEAPALCRSEISLPNKWIIVVGRGHYFESVKEYPIANIGDLKKVIKNEPSQFPFEGLLFYKIEPLPQQSSRVTFWVVRDDFLADLPNRPLLIIPESACVGVLSSGDAFAFDRLGEVVYLSETVDGIASSVGQRETFLHKIGWGLDESEDNEQELKELNEAAFLDMLLSGIYHNLIHSPARFFIGFSEANIGMFDWKLGAKLSMILPVIYLIATSLYISAANYWLDSQLLRKEAVTETWVGFRKEFDATNSLAKEIEIILSGIKPLWIAWDVFIDLNTEDVYPRAVNSMSNTVTYYLTAQRATDVLHALSNDNRVISAEFVVPVRKVNGLEQFAVKVTFKKVEAEFDLAEEEKGTEISAPSVLRDTSSLVRVQAHLGGVGRGE